MKFLFLFSLLCILVAAATAGMEIGFYNDTNHPGKCVIDDLILSPGEEPEQNSTCGRMICGQNGVLIFYTCGIQAVPEGYELGEPSKPNVSYPYCCARYVVRTVGLAD